jgi:hypothetical protein
MFFPKQQQQQPRYQQSESFYSTEDDAANHGQFGSNGGTVTHSEEHPVNEMYASSSTAGSQVDFASQETPHTVDSLFSGASSELKRLKQATPALPPALQNQDLDYIYYDERKMKGERGWSEKMCYNTGTLYGIGRKEFFMCIDVDITVLIIPRIQV